VTVTVTATVTVTLRRRQTFLDTCRSVRRCQAVAKLPLLSDEWWSAFVWGWLLSGCRESSTLNISVCLAGVLCVVCVLCVQWNAGVLGERRFFQVCEPEGLWASGTSALCWVHAGMLGERGLG
jgi:hypothetical protein